MAERQKLEFQLYPDDVLPIVSIFKYQLGHRESHICMSHSRLMNEATAHSRRFSEALVIWWGGGRCILPTQNLCGGLLESNYKYTDKPSLIYAVKEKEILGL